MAQKLRALELSQKRRDEELKRLTKQIRESNTPQTVLRDNDRSLVPSTPRSVPRQFTKNTGDLRTLTPWARPHAARLSKRKITVDGKRLSAGLASQSPAAPSHARLPTLQPAVGQVASTDDGPLVKGEASPGWGDFHCGHVSKCHHNCQTCFQQDTCLKTPTLD